MLRRMWRRSSVSLRPVLNRDRSALLELLACPDCGSKLAWDERHLICANEHRFGAADGVPELYPSVGAGGHDRAGIAAAIKHFMIARPAVYERIQRHLGGGDTADPVVMELRRSAGATLL